MSALHHPPTRPPIYGLMAEFNSVMDLIAACRAVHDAGYTRVDAFTPYPSEEVAEALGHHHSKLPGIVLGGGLLGGIAGYLLQYWTQVMVYPMNIGGRPFHSWPAFIVPTFECTILGAALAAVFGIIDWLSIKDREVKKTADWHARLNVIALLVFAASFYLRTAGGSQMLGGSHTIPFVLSVVGVILITVSGWLGGELVFRHGVAVDERADTRAEEARSA